MRALRALCIQLLHRHSVYVGLVLDEEMTKLCSCGVSFVALRASASNVTCVLICCYLLHVLKSTAA
jgi:hypothetical protein